jgi:F-type H+-transporting ATPase subunit b
LVLALTLSAAALCAQETAAHAETPAPENLTWKWVNFGLLAFGLGYLMAKSLPPLFRGRTTEIQKDITDAQKTRREAEERASAIEKRVSALAADIEAFRGQARGEMEQEAARIAEETARQIEKLKRQAALEVETAGKNAQRELKSYAAKLALDLAEQRIRTRLDASAANGLVEDFVHDLRDQSYGGESPN